MRRGGSVSGQASACGNACDQQVLGAHAQQRRRHPLAVARALEQQRRAGRSSASASSNIGAASSACTSTSRARARVQVVEDLLEREAVLRPEREHDRLLVGRRLQLEAEAAAEALAQRQAPGAVDAPAERRVHHELHAARSRRRSARARRAAASARAPSACRPARTYSASCERPAAPRRRPPQRRRATPRVRRRRRARSAHPRAGRRSPPTARACAPGASPSQNGSARRRALARRPRAPMPGSTRRIAPRRVAELEDVAAVALDREVLVERADERALGLEHAPGSRRCRGWRRRT